MKKFYKTAPDQTCPSLATEGNTGTADPCYIIPDDRWHEFCDAYDTACGRGEFDFTMFNARITAAKAGKNPSNEELMKAAGLEQPSDETVLIFHGVAFYVMQTGGDGIHDGVMVDAGILAKFDWKKAKEVFGFEMIET